MLKIRNHRIYVTWQPFYATPMSAGFDLVADAYVDIPPGATMRVPTGLSLEPPGWIQRFLSRWFTFELQIRPRSGFAAALNVTIANSPGTVDADYPNEIQVLLHNGDFDSFSVRPGERIAQAVVSIAWRARGIETKKDKRIGGFGSTGT